MAAIYEVPGGRVTPAFCREKFEEGYLPTAVCAIGAISDPRQLLTLRTNDREGVMPLVDLAGYCTEGFPKNSVEAAVQERLRGWGVTAIKSSTELCPVVLLLERGDEIVSTLEFPQLDKRMYIATRAQIGTIERGAIPAHISHAYAPAVKLRKRLEARRGRSSGLSARLLAAVNATDYYLERL